MQRVLIAGCGGMFAYWLDIVRRIGGLEVVAIVDIDGDVARARLAEFGLAGCLASTSIEEALAATRPDIVFDLTPPWVHHRVALAALGAGCHLLSEKPMAASMAEAREIVAAGARAGRVHAVMQNRRYDPHIRRMAAFLRSGVIGAPTTLHADFQTGPRLTGFRRDMEHVLLLDMAIHHFDAARLLAGAEALSVVCHEWNPPDSWFPHGASAVATFEMERGIVYTYRGSWAADGFPTTWECDWRLMGTMGSALWDGGGTMRAERVAGMGAQGAVIEPAEIAPTPPADRIGAHEGCVREFLDCVRTGATPETTAADNLHSLAMVFAAIRSAETGRRVAIADVLNA